MLRTLYRQARLRVSVRDSFSGYRIKRDAYGAIRVTRIQGGAEFAIRAGPEHEGAVPGLYDWSLALIRADPYGGATATVFDEFKEAEHARDPRGEFSKGAGAGKAIAKTEKISAPIRTTGETAELHVNPVAATVRREIEQSNAKAVRVVPLGNDLVLGDAWKTTHVEMVQAMLREAHPSATQKHLDDTRQYKSNWLLISPDATGETRKGITDFPHDIGGKKFALLANQRVGPMIPVPPAKFPPALKRLLGTRGIAADEFKESAHPRGKAGEHGGEFVKGSGGGGTAKPKPKGTGGGPAPTNGHQATKVVEGKRVTASGEPLPEHIVKLRVPPAWTAVTFSADPKAALLATGKDAKGRTQRIYSDTHSETQAAAKFARIKDLDRKFTAIKLKNEQARKSGDPAMAATADCAALIMATGIRPGSETDTGAKKQAYGATTLEGRHVVATEDGGVVLKFVGKEGVSLAIPVEDPGLRKMMLARKATAGDAGQLFPISEKKLLDHVHTLGPFKTKDFRTLVGTRTALAEVAKVKPPTTEPEYRKAVMAVAKAVSTKLGNTPKIALQSYISPTVFADWKIAA